MSPIVLQVNEHTPIDIVIEDAIALTKHMGLLVEISYGDIKFRVSKHVTVRDILEIYPELNKETIKVETIKVKIIDIKSKPTRNDLMDIFRPYKNLYTKFLQAKSKSKTKSKSKSKAKAHPRGDRTYKHS